MYKSGDILMHPGLGVCEVKEITKREIAKNDIRTYYILKPVYGNSSTTVFLPVDCDKVNVRKLLSKDEIFEIIHSVPLDKTLWVDNDHERPIVFSEIIKEGNQANIIKLIIELHKHQRKCLADGKKFRIVDSKILNEAEKIIHEEFAYSMDLKLEDVAPFVINELNLNIDED